MISMIGTNHIALSSRPISLEVYAFQPLLKGLATDAKQLKKTSSHTDAMYELMDHVSSFGQTMNRMKSKMQSFASFGSILEKYCA